MKRTLCAGRAPSWLLRHPELLAHWLMAINALRRLTQNRRRAALLAGTVFVGASLILYAAFFAMRSAAVHLIEPLLAYWAVVLLLALVHAFMTVSRRLRRGKAAMAKSWLSAAPIRPASVTLTRVVVAVGPIVGQWIAICALVALIAVIESAQAGSARKLMGAISAGALIGSLLGFWRPKPKPRTSYEDSRYARAMSVTDQQPLRASAAALSHWPVNLTLAWSRPENSRALVVIALLSVQSGTSMLGGMAVIAMWFSAAYLGSLLAAVVHVAREAGMWLRSTPMRFHAFAWPIARRALLHQIAGTTIAMGLMMLQGAPPAMAAYLGAMWLTVVALVCAISLADSYRNRSPVVKIALSLTTLAAMEIRAHAWSIPLAVLIGAWHLRAGAKS